MVQPKSRRIASEAYADATKWDRPPMPATADFNDYVTPGYTPVPTATGKSNAPSTLPGGLTVSGLDGTNVMQEYMTSETVPKTISRRRSAGSWGVWTDGAERAMGGRGILPAATDLNSLNLTIHNGPWALTGANWASYLNLPSGITADRGTLEVIAPNNWTVTHRVYPSSGTKRYERIMLSPAPLFAPWQAMDTAGEVVQTQSTTDWVHWGDSLTDDAALGVDAWVAKLSALTGKNHINEGWYGHLAAQIAARQGGNPALMTVAGGTIPASGTSVKVTAATPHVSMPVGTQQPTRQVPGTLAGRTGYLVDGGVDESDGFFMPTDGKASSTATGKQAFTPTGNADLGRNRIMTICIGENDIWASGPSPQHVAYMARQMHDYQSTSVKRVFVLSIPDRFGNATAAKVNAINEALKAELPSQFLDVAGYLRTDQAATDAVITYTADDLSDIAGGFTPRVFRLPGDSVHYNALACSIIAPFIYAAARDRGWV